MSKGVLLVMVCLTAVSAQLCETVRQEFLDAHNNLRSKIALGNYMVNGATKPSATNMLKMKWSSTLESQSQAIADTCVFEHSETQGVGENLYTAWDWGEITLDGYGVKASDTWASEFQEKGWEGTKYESGKGYGHATQMVWAESGAIGCGAAICDDDSQVLIVCQYQKPGNYREQPIYIEGPTCSQCPSGTICDEPTGLCD